MKTDKEITLKADKEVNFYYEGRLFSNEVEFWTYICEWGCYELDEGEFNRLFDNLKKQIWMNISKIKISNGDMNEILMTNFLHLLKQIKSLLSQKSPA